MCSNFLDAFEKQNIYGSLTPSTQSQTTSNVLAFATTAVDPPRVGRHVYVHSCNLSIVHVINIDDLAQQSQLYRLRVIWDNTRNTSVAWNTVFSNNARFMSNYTDELNSTFTTLLDTQYRVHTASAMQGAITTLEWPERIYDGVLVGSTTTYTEPAYDVAVVTSSPQYGTAVKEKKFTIPVNKVMDFIDATPAAYYGALHIFVTRYSDFAATPSPAPPLYDHCEYSLQTLWCDYD